MISIALYNNKGGVGKTTSVINISQQLALKDKSVLVVDLDGQANCSRFFVDEPKAGLAEALIEYVVAPENAKCKTRYPNIDIITATAELNKILPEFGALDEETQFKQVEKIFSFSEMPWNLNALKTNIRYPSDDVSLREVRYDAVNFKDGETTHILLQNGDKSAALSPETMSKTEMKNICKDKLGMSEHQAELAVSKAVKIDSQIKSKISERTIDEKGISQEIHIERTGAQTFSVQLGDKSKFYNANTINLEDKIAKDFGIPKENARNIISKAKSQSLLQNKIAKSTSSKKAAPTTKIELGKGKKR